ncbi:unnamed protein product [Brugia timori]|uniref:Transposase n=1 Tax=Brugia timori TaxID=42155 RepID=A0A0R3R5X2_9BILA|nr:unnamed protein product [Brugia timori]
MTHVYRAILSIRKHLQDFLKYTTIPKQTKSWLLDSVIFDHYFALESSKASPPSITS